VCQFFENNIIAHHPNSPTHRDDDFHEEMYPQLGSEAFQDD
jgi:hypothetical protein